MKAPTSLFDRPGRTAVAVGTVVAISASAAVALISGTAAADEPGRCVKNVNVREEPDVTSRIVQLCVAGTDVQTGESQDGFVQLIDLGGWAAQEYISVNGEPPAPAERPTAPEPAEDAADENTDDETAGEDNADEGDSGEEDSGEEDSAEQASTGG
jgi:hypothetical protein